MKIKATMITFVIIMIFAAGFTAIANKPTQTGVKYPAAVDGQTGSVTGRVTSATNTTGIVGAYIAIVNASNVSEEYCNTTSGADGKYQIIGINATYNATNLSEVGPNGKEPYEIYAYTSYGEGYSAAFGIDSSSGTSSLTTGASTGASQIAVAIASPAPTTVATPTATQAANQTSTPAPSPEPTIAPSTAATTPTPTPTTPAPAYVFSLLSLLAAGYVAIGTVSRRKKN